VAVDRIDRILYRQRVLPEQLERARTRLAHLEREAASYGMLELLSGQQQQQVARQ
jgi:hypothetical protein